MARSMYIPDDLGNEVAVPSGYYQPLEEGFLDYNGRRLLYVLGTACIEASCCGIGSWEYVRVEGYIADREANKNRSEESYTEVETIEDETDKIEISKLLQDRHPGARIEFR